MSSYGVPPVPPNPGMPLAVPSGGTLNQDLPCRKCGYNLRGLSPAGRCPECGTAVGYSLQGDLLRFCDPNWVETLRRGASLFIWGVVVIFFGILGAILIEQFMNVKLGPVGIVIVLGGRVLITVGWWLMTQPDPSGLGEDQYGTARKIIRIALIVGVADTALAMVTERMLLDDASVLALQFVHCAATAVDVVGLFAQFYYLGRIALRIPDPKLSARARFLMFALGIPYALVFLLQVIIVLTGGRAIRGAASSSGLGCLVIVIGIVLLVFLVMYLLLVERMGRRFKEQARAARATWAATAFTR